MIIKNVNKLLKKIFNNNNLITSKKNSQKLINKKQIKNQHTSKN